MHSESSHGSRSRERVAENVYRRRTKDGQVVYEVQFRDVDGRQRLQRLDARSERAAVREARAVLAQRDGGDRVVAADLTLGQLAERDYWPMLDGLADSGRRSRRGVELYRNSWRLYIADPLGDLRLGQIDAATLANWMQSLRARGLSESTIYGALLVVRTIYRLAIRRGLVARSPIDGLDPAELPRPRRGSAGRVLTEQELAALVRHASDYYRPVVTALAFTGLRTSEVLGLRWQDVDFVESELNVRFQLSRDTKDTPAELVAPKTRASERVVPLWPAVERMLVDVLASEQLRGRGRDDDYVFCTRRGTPLAHRNVARRGVGAAGEGAALGWVTPHDLRRSFCSLAARRGVDPVAAAELTGHSVAVWATSYARSYGPDQRREARQRLLDYGFGALDPDDCADTLLTREPSETVDE
jgi:integrase